MKSQNEKLFDEYRKVRGSSIQITEFNILIQLFPLLMMCMAEGVITKLEWTRLFSALSSLKESSKKLLQSELKYLLDHRQLWEKKFLSVLKTEFIENRTNNEFSNGVLHLFKYLCDGTKLTQTAFIDKLTDRLELVY